MARSSLYIQKPYVPNIHTGNLTLKTLTGESGHLKHFIIDNKMSRSSNVCCLISNTVKTPVEYIHQMDLSNTERMYYHFQHLQKI